LRARGSRYGNDLLLRHEILLLRSKIMFEAKRL
jgi:hypothetical protein